MEITLEPIAFVRNSRTEMRDDDCGASVSHIELTENLPDEVFAGIAGFSHLEIIYYFNQVSTEPIVYSGAPKGNAAFPSPFAQRKKDRPDRIGNATVELLKLHGRAIQVKFLDALDGTPVLDIKPVFQAKPEIRRPAWVADLRQNYWRF